MADDHYNSSSASAPSPPAAAAEAAAVVGSSVIPIGNKPQNIFLQLGSSSTIDLPQVSVVGSQSSGKSSVLEVLVGRDFLPRGSDICTRLPLVLQLMHQLRRPADAEWDKWDEFLHHPGRRFYEFPDIRREIQARPWTRCLTAAPSIASTRSQVNGTSVVGRMSLTTSFHVEEHVPWYPRVASFYTCREFYVYIAIFVIVWNIVWLSG